jgi:hypothetical protein
MSIIEKAINAIGKGKDDEGQSPVRVLLPVSPVKRFDVLETPMLRRGLFPNKELPEKKVLQVEVP